MEELPLFPLHGVLLPKGRMPLQIFEQRYLDLVRDCLRNNAPFGVTIEGDGRFDLCGTRVEANGLVMGRVEPRPAPPAAPMAPQWQAMLDVLQSLEIHPHVQRLAMQVDHGDAWQVAWGLAQLLPLDESLKYQWLGLDDAGLLLAQLDRVLNQISGEE